VADLQTGRSGHFWNGFFCLREIRLDSSSSAWYKVKIENGYQNQER